MIIPVSPSRFSRVKVLRRSTSPLEQKESGVLCFAAVDWWYHNRAHSDVQLAKNLARGRPVLLVNSIGLRVPLPGRSSQPMRRVLRKAASLTRGVRRPIPDLPGFYVFSPVAIPPQASPRLRRASALLVRWQVQAVSMWLGIRRPHLLVTIPSAVDVTRGMPCSSLVFNRSDLQSAFPEADGGLIEQMENELLRTADAVIYVSRELMELDREVVGERAYYLGHGLDLDHFTRVPTDEQPADIRSIPGPRIGFFGGIDDYVVDLELIERLSVELPDAQVILIGDATCNLDRLTARPNVTWLGMRPYEEIPAYGSAFDVAIMPWLSNSWIRFCNPIKLKEYLALGLPVVTTDYPELASMLRYVRVATPDGFSTAVREALAEPLTPEAVARRRVAVARDTWSTKADELRDLMRSSAGRGRV